MRFARGHAQENLLPRFSGGLRGRDSHPPVDQPFTGHALNPTIAIATELATTLLARQKFIDLRISPRPG